jgi:hypothetical protein
VPAGEGGKGHTHNAINTSSLKSIRSLNLHDLTQVDVTLGSLIGKGQPILTNSSRDAGAITEAEEANVKVSQTPYLQTAKTAGKTYLSWKPQVKPWQY